MKSIKEVYLDTFDTNKNPRLSKGQLPTIFYKGSECTVDFRLGEMRCVDSISEPFGLPKDLRSIKFIKFTDLKLGVMTMLKELMIR